MQQILTNLLWTIVDQPVMLVLLKETSSVAWSFYQPKFKNFTMIRTSYLMGWQLVIPGPWIVHVGSYYFGGQMKQESRNLMVGMQHFSNLTTVNEAGLLYIYTSVVNLLFTRVSEWKQTEEVTCSAPSSVWFHEHYVTWMYICKGVWALRGVGKRSCSCGGILVAIPTEKCSSIFPFTD